MEADRAIGALELEVDFTGIVDRVITDCTSVIDKAENVEKIRTKDLIQDESSKLEQILALHQKNAEDWIKEIKEKERIQAEQDARIKMLEKQVEEQKTLNEEQKTHIEEQKTLIDKLQKGNEEQKTQSVELLPGFKILQLQPDGRPAPSNLGFPMNSGDKELLKSLG